MLALIIFCQLARPGQMGEAMPITSSMVIVVVLLCHCPHRLTVVTELFIIDEVTKLIIMADIEVMQGQFCWHSALPAILCHPAFTDIAVTRLCFCHHGTKGVIELYITEVTKVRMIFIEDMEVTEWLIMADVKIMLKQTRNSCRLV